MNSKRKIAIIFLLLFIAGCANTPKYYEVKNADYWTIKGKP